MTDKGPRPELIEQARAAWEKFTVPGVENWISHLTMEQAEIADKAIIEFWCGFAVAYAQSREGEWVPVEKRLRLAIEEACMSLAEEKLLAAIFGEVDYLERLRKIKIGLENSLLPSPPLEKGSKP